MFKDDKNLIKLSDEIFWYKSFISQEDVEKINKIAYDIDYGNHWFENIEFKVTPAISQLLEFWNKVSNFIAPEYVIHPMLSMLYFGEGKQMLPHADSPGEGNYMDATVPDPWSTVCLLSHGVCLYFGDFTGGEVYYPHQNIEIPVQPGDLVIHGALKTHEHGVRPVKSGIRYTYSNFALPIEKNPGSFYNFGTEEIKEHQKDLFSWLQPLFSNDKSVVLDNSVIKENLIEK